MNSASWQPLTPYAAETVAVLDIDANGLDEVLLDLGPSNGLWAFVNNYFWGLLHSVSPEDIVAARLH